MQSRLLCFGGYLLFFGWCALAADVWECPSPHYWPEPCWSSNSNWAVEMRSCDGGITSDCWNCAACHVLRYGVDFGSKYNLNGMTSTPCPDNMLVLADHVVPFASTADSCSKFHYECDSGYYNASGTCVACATVVGTYSCGLGYFPKRCPHTSELGDKDALCEACTYPPLDPLAVSDDGLAMYRYGRGQLYDNCFSYLRTLGGDVNSFNHTLCANFQTPKWDKGWCKLECALGFVPLVAAPTGVIGGLPTCQRCETYCAAGTYPPVCNGGAIPFLNLDGKCVACTGVHKPTNAEWTQGCEWAPSRGFYYDTLSQAVLPCIAAAECGSSYFMGCHDSNPGACVDCAALGDCPANTYFSSELYMDQCECTPCNMAVEGATYWARPCTAHMDGWVLPCSTECSTAFAYISSACTLYSDIQCTPCTPPRLGLRLTTPCSSAHDALYDACPDGMACDGSSQAFYCTDGRKAQSGVCLCPLNTVMDSTGACRVIACDPGRYADTLTAGCQSCTDSDSVSAVTLPNVLGVSACTCPAGYFIRSYARTTSASRIHCWPCGNLECERAVQRQTTCSGLTMDEPSCSCAAGPGMLLHNFTFAQPLCAVRCMPGYQATAALVPALRDQYDFLSLASVSVSWRARFLYSPVTAMCVLDMSTVLVLCAEGLVVVRPHDFAMFPTVNVFIASMSGFGARSAILQFHSLLSHDSMFPGYVWFVFRFRGNCLGYQLDTEQGVCWAIQLMALQSSARSDQATCMSNLGLCVYMKAGIDFQPTALISSINCIALGTQGRTLLVAWNDTKITRYPVQTVGTTTLPGAQWLYDDADHLTAPIVSLAEGLHDAVYVLLQSGALRVLTSTGSSSLLLLTFSSIPQRLVAFPPGGHLFMIFLMADGWHQVDTLNTLVSSHAFSPHAMATFYSTSVAYANATDIWVETGVSPCGMDTVSYRFLTSMDASECEALACTKSEPCGPHSLRRLGSADCVCDPGYYYASAGFACLPCGSAGLSFYCPGDSAPVACPNEYSITFMTGTASSLLDCLCPPGMYHFDTHCVPCAAGFFCPLNGTLVPLPCHANGLTIQGSVSPMDCMCPPRTHGLACAACTDHEDCESAYSYVSVLLVTVEAWASSMFAVEQLRSCLQPIATSSVLYSVLGITASFMPVSTTSTVSELLFWNWYLVLQATTGPVQTNLSDCLAANGFLDVNVQIKGQSQKTLVSNMSYRGRMEWNGDYDVPAPTCVAGYEVNRPLFVFRLYV